MLTFSKHAINGIIAQSLYFILIFDWEILRTLNDNKKLSHKEHTHSKFLGELLSKCIQTYK